MNWNRITWEEFCTWVQGRQIIRHRTAQDSVTLTFEDGAEAQAVSRFKSFEDNSSEVAMAEPPMVRVRICEAPLMETEEDRLRAQVEELEGQLSSMVSSRDHTIQKLREELRTLQLQRRGRQT